MSVIRVDEKVLRDHEDDAPELTGSLSNNKSTAWGLYSGG